MSPLRMFPISFLCNKTAFLLFPGAGAMHQTFAVLYLIRRTWDIPDGAPGKRTATQSQAELHFQVGHGVRQVLFIRINEQRHISQVAFLQKPLQFLLGVRFFPPINATYNGGWNQSFSVERVHDPNESVCILEIFTSAHVWE